MTTPTGLGLNLLSDFFIPLDVEVVNSTTSPTANDCSLVLYPQKNEFELFAVAPARLEVVPTDAVQPLSPRTTPA